MKKTLTVNLGGTVFNIDDDAYRLLDNYLSNLKMHFRQEAGADEIVDDIERRISELFAEKLSAGSQVITIADVEEVIARMGKPEDMEAEGESASADSGSTSAVLDGPKQAVCHDVQGMHGGMVHVVDHGFDLSVCAQPWLGRWFQ